MFGRGSVVAFANCQRPSFVVGGGSSNYEFEVELDRPGTNLVNVCTQPSLCGTAYCQQRRIDCDESSCVDRGDLPPVLRSELQCEAR